jgi:hypothetical protein
LDSWFAAFLGISAVVIMTPGQDTVLGEHIDLFDNIGERIALQPIAVVEAPGVTHLRFRVVR